MDESSAGEAYLEPSVTIETEMKKMNKKVNDIFGYRRLTKRLCKELKMTTNKKRVQRLMKAVGIECVTRRKRKGYIKSTPQHIAENILNRKLRQEHQIRSGVQM